MLLSGFFPLEFTFWQRDTYRKGGFNGNRPAEHGARADSILFFYLDYDYCSLQDII